MPHVLPSLIKGKPLGLYIVTLEHSLGALLAHENAEVKESAVYYLSQMVLGPKDKYSPIEKVC